MRRVVFYVLFALIVLGLFYAPGKAESNFCFSGETRGQEFDIYYEGFDGEVEINFYGDRVGVLLPKIESGSLVKREVFAEKQRSENGNDFYTFSYQRPEGVLKYNLEFYREDNTNGKYCYYKTQKIGDDIKSFFGGASLSEKCMELVNGRVQSEGIECAASVECDVKIRSGEKRYYGIGVKKESCGEKLSLYPYEVRPEKIDEMADSFFEDESLLNKEYGAGTKKTNAQIKGFSCGRKPGVQETAGDSNAKVYAMRGILPGFGQSEGLNELIQINGVGVKIGNVEDWESFSEEIISSRPSPLFIVGHSAGGDNAVQIANKLKENGISVRGMFLLDPPGWTSLEVPSNVAEVWYWSVPAPNGNGNMATLEDSTKTTLYKMNVPFGVNHLNVDEYATQLIVNLIGERI